MKKRILSILLTLCMVLCLMPTAVFAEGNEDTPTQALTNVAITFPAPKVGENISEAMKAASGDADSGLKLYLFGPALWQQDGKHQKLKANDTYQKDSIYLLNFTFYTQKPITEETALTFNGNPIARYADYQALTEALNAYDGKEDAYLGLVMFSENGFGDPSMGDLKNIYIIKLYALVRAQEAQTPEDTVKEQFNLDPGGTYYFDLSGENIPGTANDSLPDKTMHYVPFTYAGTVDAYKLTSEKETTEEHAQKNKYPHSLFIADYNVTFNVDWNQLNEKQMIFGTPYTSYGVNYTMRAPSAGSQSNNGKDDSSTRGIPKSNEWDAILDKANQDWKDNTSGYIKNWSGKYSFGQDNYANASRRAFRGYYSARFWTSSTATFSGPIVGFRPVLEILNADTLGPDGLKVVTLDLNGGKLGNSSEEIQIIVKNGSAFTAPTSDGLTRPNGNTGSYFRWLGSDGNLYAPGKSVPANVTKLTALFHEQFNFALGGRYYFDLSAMGIPGTVNDALPDKTMHYVPFTYAGTVDAYALTSEKETTEEYAQQNKYPHSLFIADYNVTHKINWDDLNTANLIFGKDYAASGVDYTLRAPSAGSRYTGSGESQRGTPQSNEWDRVLDKDDGYIKNRNKVYSWGQDTPNFGSGFRAVRGYYSARHWYYYSSSYQNVDLGFRPVLEVPNPGSLGPGGLKAVTLDLGGGKLGGSTDTIQIIVKNGSKFTAPASDSLTRPDGNNGSYFKWLGSDGNLYAPGESVPEVVTTLTAQWTVNQYTITYNLAGGTAEGNPSTYTIETKAFTLKNPTKSGYTFTGWSGTGLDGENNMTVTIPDDPSSRGYIFYDTSEQSMTQLETTVKSLESASEADPTITNMTKDVDEQENGMFSMTFTYSAGANEGSAAGFYFIHYQTTENGVINVNLFTTRSSNSEKILELIDSIQPATENAVEYSE